MTSSRLLRLAAALACVQGLAHITLLLTAHPTHGPAEAALISQMKAQSFLFAGSPRTYWGFYLGYALMVGGACLVESGLLWLLARLAAASPTQLRPILRLLIAANLAHAALAQRYFFPLPILFDLLVSLALMLAIRNLGKTLSPA